MLNRVTAGAAPYANPQTAFYRQDGGANALTGIRASRSQFIKRTAAPDGIRTRIPSKRKAADPRLKPHDYRDRQMPKRLFMFVEYTKFSSFSK